MKPIFQLLPYINGIKHVARVAADADVETNLVIFKFFILLNFDSFTSKKQHFRVESANIFTYNFQLKVDTIFEL